MKCMEIEFKGVVIKVIVDLILMVKCGFWDIMFMGSWIDLLFFCLLKYLNNGVLYKESIVEIDILMY